MPLMSTHNVAVTNSSRIIVNDPTPSGSVEDYYNLSCSSSGFSSIAESGVASIPGSSRGRHEAKPDSKRFTDIIFRLKHDEDSTKPKLKEDNEDVHDSGFDSFSKVNEDNDDVGEYTSDSIIWTKSGVGMHEYSTITDDQSDSNSEYSNPSPKRCVIKLNQNAKVNCDDDQDDPGDVMEIKDKMSYECQDVSIWLGAECDVKFNEVTWRCTATGIKRKTWLKRVRRRVQGADEDMYESIYEVVNPPERHQQQRQGDFDDHDDEEDDDFYSESDFDEILMEEEEAERLAAAALAEDQNRLKLLNNGASAKSLTKFAEAFQVKAGKKMKKLRRNWSLRKNDITRSLSKIKVSGQKRPSFITSSGDLIFRDPLKKKSSSVTARRAPSFKSPATSNVVKCNRVENTTFYITLNIEDVNDEPSGPKSMVYDLPSVTSSSKSSSKRRTSSATQYAVIRPTEAPPAPPAFANATFNYNDKSEVGSSSSSSSGSALGTDLDLEENYTSSLFQTEPLYQFYDINVDGSDTNTLTNVSLHAENESVDDQDKAENMYESLENLDRIGQDQEQCEEKENLEGNKTSESNGKGMPRSRRKLGSRCSAMELVLQGQGRRSMWGELSEVIESGILASIGLEEKRLREALFEVVSSEASYLKSLNVLISHFVQSPKLFGTNAVISKRDHRVLFSDIVAVRQVSERFLADLEKRWQESVLLDGISKIILAHAKSNFQVYVKYCSNQVYQDRMLKKLASENAKFVEALKELESSSVCQSLNMHSFLMLPMQRITRFPLLVSAIFHRLGQDSEDFEDCQEALGILNKLVKDCNESARSMERMEEMLILSQQLDFREVKALPLISASRWLVKKGEATRIWWKEASEAKLTFGRRVNRQSLFLFLFTDLLVVTKRKSDDNYLVIDHCPRNLVTLSEVDSNDGVVPSGSGKVLSDASNHLAWITLLQNNENKTIEWLVSFSAESDRLRWMEAVTPSQASSNPEEKIYELWDCPQVVSIQDYSAQDADEVNLVKGDKANVLRKLSNSGWCYVEKQVDGSRGWIPTFVTKEIESNHVRARNFKQRHAFLKLLSTESESGAN